MNRSKFQIWGVGLLLLASSLMLIGAATEGAAFLITGLILQVIAMILLIKHLGKRSINKDDLY
ncbi:hypothetical protein [Terribacillus sp. DMT04]|uniref:hypothetical protein n=1 Tax=Terribacillus sp. DMT04 TaxID=2850441 RepID=UPI001C2C8EBA|nr:hypothetical protein [Terribacillus sp. DMT04]QXE00637.1 hypothetical protein KS242_11470 [Terribacillus sp. DMT04]